MKKKIKVEQSVLWHRIARIFKWIPALIITFLLISFALFQIPKIQTRILNELSTFIAQNTSFRLTIGHANLTWYDEFLFDDIRLYQAANDSTLIHIDNLSIDFGLFHYLLHREIKGDQLILGTPSLHLIKPNDSTEMNISLFVNELKSVFKKTKSKKKTSIFIDEISIKNGNFSYNQLSQDSLLSDKNTNRFSYNQLNSQLINFALMEDSIGLHIDSLKVNNPNSLLDIKSLTGDFYFTPHTLGLTKMKLHTNRSYISDSIVLRYSNSDQLKYFEDSVDFDLNLNDSQIDTRDLLSFSNNATKLGNIIQISGLLRGSFKKFSIEQLKLRFGNSKINGYGFFNGLPDIRETFIDFHFNNSQLEAIDLQNIVNKNILDKLQRMTHINLDGYYSGFTSNFVTTGTLLSDQGIIKSDINLSIDKYNTAHYEGKINLQQFSISEVFEEIQNVKKISLNGEIKGKGLQIDNANFDLNAQIDSVQFERFGLKNISTIGHFEKQFLNADFEIFDPKLIFNGSAEVDLREGYDKFRIDASLDTLDLFAMGYIDKPLNISSVLDINMKGLKIDEMKGYMNLTNNYINYDNNQLQIDSISLISLTLDNTREINLSTDDLSAQLKGSFTSNELFSSINNLTTEILLNLQNDSSSIRSYYEEKNSQVLSKLNADLKLKLRNINQYIQPFYPEFHISKNIQIDSHLSQDSVTVLSFYSSIDTIQFKDQNLYLSEMDINISKNFYDKDLLASLTLQSASQVWNKDIETENLSTELIWNSNDLTFWTSLKQPKYNNNINLSADVNFYTDHTSIHMVPARLKLLDKRWMWHESNQIRITTEDISFTNFGLSNGSQKIEANGIYGESVNQSIIVNLTDIELNNIQSILPFKLEGLIDGSVKIKKGETNSKLDGVITARALKVDDFLVGNLFVNSNWDHDHQGLELDVGLVRNGDKKLDLSGTYYPQRTNNQLNLNAEFFNADLEALDPFLRKNFSNVKGNISGKVKVKGNVNAPSMNGEINISEGQIKVNYLNTSYLVQGNIQIQDRTFSTDNLMLTDKEGYSAMFFGNVELPDLKTINLNMDGKFQNFQILNTNSIDNKLYYGSAYASGSVQFRGTSDDLVINASAKSEKGTKLSFPINQNKNFKTDQKEYIQFINLSEKDKDPNQPSATKTEASSNLKGIRLDLDLELTSDAYIELIFDIKSGDIIRGRGDGNLNLLINTDGDFSMLGDYAIDQGGYNFTLYNIINKEFEIKKGSSIAWYGDPYGAILNIDASYKQLASLVPILTTISESDQSLIELRKKYPTLVELKLSDNLLSPDILFDINIEEYPRTIAVNTVDGDGVPVSKSIDLEREVNAFKTKIRNNEQEMNRQVFSLLILRRFSPENSFQINSETIGSSLSEFVSNQLSYWATQVDENLEIDVDLASLDEDAFNTFQLRLSYTFLDGRLKVTRGGGIPNDQNNDNIYSFIGDWSVEYLLTEDGRFRAKVYSRADQNTIDSQTNPNSVETGFSLLFIRSFDELKNIIRDARDKKITEKAAENAQ